MTLEQILKWKHGSFEEYTSILNEQERLFKKIKKLNFDIEVAEDAKSCFNLNIEAEREKYEVYDNVLKGLIKRKEKLELQVKENNERLEKEFY